MLQLYGESSTEAVASYDRNNRGPSAGGHTQNIAHLMEYAVCTGGSDVLENPEWCMRRAVSSLFVSFVAAFVNKFKLGFRYSG